MQIVTTALELAGALLIIAGVAVVLAPLVGIGFAAVVAGLLLIGLSLLVERVRR